MSPALWHLLILWMALVSCPRMTTSRSRYVSEFEYVPWLHPSRNPNCPSRFIGAKRDREDSEEWDRPSIEIKAVLSRCSTIGEERMTTDDVDIGRKRRNIEEQDRGTITNCTRKIMISMRFANLGQTEIEEKFVVIDHVLDPLTMRKIPLQNPYVIKVRQEAVLQLYGLTFQSVVNAEAREEVINNWAPNYTGCDVGYVHPTCGQTFLRGKPVPFSQGFCCPCDSRLDTSDGYEGWNAWRESSVVLEKLNNEEATNKPCNRFRLGSECGSSDDNPVARSQAKEDEARTGKKSNASGSGSGTMSVPVSETRGESVATSSESPWVNKEAEKLGSHGTRQTSYTVATEPKVDEERHTGKRMEASSSSSRGFERAPSGDKATSGVEVGEDRGSKLENDVCERRTGRISKQGGFGMRNSADRTRTQTNNHGFHSIESRTGLEKLSREEESADGRKNPAWKNSSSDSTRSSDSNDWTTRESVKKSAILSQWRKANEEEYVGRKKYKPGSLRVDKGALAKSGKKRKRVFPVPSSVDSPAIRPSMHLNEPLKNLSTGVLNSNRSPGLADRAKAAGGGNLNGVMGNTSPSRGIRVGSFNEKHGRDRPEYTGSGGNERDRSSSETFGKDRPKLVSNMAAGGGNAFGKDDFPRSGKKRYKEKSLRNYTPQKRTLKDLSYRNSQEFGGESKKRGVRGYRVKANPQRNWRNSRFTRSRSKRFDASFRGRSRRRKRSRNTRHDEESWDTSRTPGHAIRVYVDEFPEDEKPRLKGKLGTMKEKNGLGHENIDETDRQDTLDERIEEKFSRISDALKEDTMGSKGFAKEQTAIVNPMHKVLRNLGEVRNKLEDEETPSYNPDDEIPYGKEATRHVLDGKIDIDGRSPSYPVEFDSEDASSDQLIFSNRRDNWIPSVDNLDAWSNDFKSSTSDSELVILPPMDQNPVTSNTFAPENEFQPRFDSSDNDAPLYASFTTEASDLTRSLIVVDLFKVVTDSLTEPPATVAQPRLVERLGGLKKNIEKAFQQLRPVNASITTIMLTESTTSNATTLESTTVETTRITDKVFRPPIKPVINANETSIGGAEFDKEVVIEGVTIPEDLDTSMTHVSATQRPYDDLDNSMTHVSRTQRPYDDLGTTMTHTSRTQRPYDDLDALMTHISRTQRPYDDLGTTMTHISRTQRPYDDLDALITHISRTQRPYDDLGTSMTHVSRTQRTHDDLDNSMTHISRTQRPYDDLDTSITHLSRTQRPYDDMDTSITHLSRTQRPYDDLDTSITHLSRTQQPYDDLDNSMTHISRTQRPYDDLDTPMTHVSRTQRPYDDLDSISGLADRPRKRFRKHDRRKRKRTSASMMERQVLQPTLERLTETDEKVHRHHPPNHEETKRSSRKDSPAIKFSLESANMDVVKEELGVTGSYSREQRNYLQVRVADPGESKGIGCKSRNRVTQKDEEEVGNEARDDSVNDSVNAGRNGEAGFRSEASATPRNKRIHHPRFVTTETSEYRRDNHDGVFSSKSSGKRRNEARVRESSWVPATDGVPGRILPPCGKSRRGGIEERGTKRVICEAETDRRGRRLLSVQKPKDAKSVSDHRSNKDRKKIAEDEDDASDMEYEEGATERRKRLKSERDKDREKSKKRKKKNEDRRKEVSGNYDYSESGEQVDEDDGTETLLDERQGDDSNLQGSFGNYDSDPTLQELLGKEGNLGSRTLNRDDDPYDRLTDQASSVDEFDKYPESLRAQNSARSLDSEKSESGEGEPGKDFEISLTGKIHLESDSYGRPVSISFNAAPEFPRKDFIDDGKANGYGNRFPSESANSFIDASDTLVSAGTDNANFLPDVFDVEPPVNSPLDRLDDRSIAREYSSDAIRARYRNELDPRQRLLRLQKKSVGAGKDVATSSGISGAWKRNLKRSKKASEFTNRASNENLDEGETPMEGRDDAPDSGQDMSFGGDRNRDSAASNEADSKKTANEFLDDLPRVSFDLASLPGSGLASADLGNRDAPMKDVDIGRGAGNDTCFAPNMTTQGMDIPETTVTDKYLGAVTKPTLLSYQDLKIEASGSPTGPETDTPAAPTTTTPVTTTVTTSANETVIQARISYPKPAAAFEKPQGVSEYNVSEDSKESIERKNMLAISEFVKKLETLVADTGNSTNATGRTLIHLKKFIIVPDNRTFWSLKEFSEPEDGKETATTETVIVMGEGAKPKLDKQYSENEDEDEKSRAEDRDLIKEIIGSVIDGSDLKREVTGSANLNDLNPPRDLRIDSSDASRDLQEEGSDGQELVTRLKDGMNSDEASMLDGLRRDAGKNIDDRFHESNPGKKTSGKNNDVCGGNKSSVKEKRETAVNNARSPSGKGEHGGRGKKKDAKHPKKKRRRKRKRKTKKGKGDRDKKNSKKTKSKWLFRRNLLMLSEEEQIQPSSEDYGMERRGRDKFSAREGKNVRVSKKSDRGYRSRKPQIRGGQDCADRRHPPRVDPLKYLQSTHCLRFSDLWYSVYRLDEPMIAHRMHLQIYAKRTSPEGSISWKDLSNGSSIRLGTFDDRYRNEEATMAFRYSDMEPTRNVEYNLDPARDRLLVPSTITGKRSKYSEVEGWSNEYLVVQADKINEDANECDKAGVGFTAFVGQPDRCERVSGTCLKNQPLDYWRHDIEARQSGRAGCYFLSNFARVPSEAIKYNVNGTGSREFLALEYHSLHVSVIDVELRDDYNALLRAGSSGRLTEVHVDNTAIDYTVITALITNKGSSSSSYRVRITDCPKGLPVSWSNAESATRTVSPHRDRKVALDLNGRLSLNEFSCSAVLLNRYDEAVAWREIKVRKMDRCLCVRHCVCTCMANAHDATSCRPMLLEHYHAAGFRGPLPSEPVEQLNWPAIVAIVSLVLTALLLFLLVLGVLKWIIGMCAPAVSRRGLDDILGPSRMREYFEKDLKSKSLVFDQFKQPVHPDTGLKSVRICDRKSEFFLNLTFFFVYPFVRLCLCCSRPQRPSQPSSFVESKASLTSDKDESPTMVCVSTYGDDINSKMEAEDTRYVIDELKKSRESLQSRDRYKRKQTLGEQSSSD